LDIDSVGDASVLDSVYENFKQVIRNEPDFVIQPWYIPHSDSLIEERGKLVQVLQIQ